MLNKLNIYTPKTLLNNRLFYFYDYEYIIYRKVTKR